MQVDPGFSVVKVAHTYTVLDGRWMSIRTEHRFHLEALRRERFFLRPYMWDNEVGIEKLPIIKTGRNPSGTSSHRLQGPVIAGQRGSRLALIDLGRVFDVGEPETLEIEHFFVRTDPGDYGFVGHAAVRGCTEILLEAFLPVRSDLRPRIMCGYVDTPGWRENDPISPIGQKGSRLHFQHVVTDPEPGVRYRIQWDQM
jgi:hypothetical protein